MNLNVNTKNMRMNMDMMDTDVTGLTHNPNPKSSTPGLSRTSAVIVDGGSGIEGIFNQVRARMRAFLVNALHSVEIEKAWAIVYGYDDIAIDYGMPMDQLGSIDHMGGMDVCVTDDYVMMNAHEEEEDNGNMIESNVNGSSVVNVHKEDQQQQQHQQHQHQVS